MLLGTLGASFLGNLLTDKLTISTGQGTIRNNQSRPGLSMPPHSFNFGIQKNYQNEPKLNSAYLSYNLPKIQDGAGMINLNEFKSIGANWIPLHVSSNNGRGSYDPVYFNIFGLEQISKDI